MILGPNDKEWDRMRDTEEAEEYAREVIAKIEDAISAEPELLPEWEDNKDLARKATEAFQYKEEIETEILYHFGDDDYSEAYEIVQEHFKQRFDSAQYLINEADDAGLD